MFNEDCFIKRACLLYTTASAKPVSLQLHVNSHARTHAQARDRDKRERRSHQQRKTHLPGCMLAEGALNTSFSEKYLLWSGP
jgi:hypothetical protein